MPHSLDLRVTIVSLLCLTLPVSADPLPLAEAERQSIPAPAAWMNRVIDGRGDWTVRQSVGESAGTERLVGLEALERVVAILNETKVKTLSPMWIRHFCEAVLALGRNDLVEAALISLVPRQARKLRKFLRGEWLKRGAETWPATTTTQMVSRAMKRFVNVMWELTFSEARQLRKPSVTLSKDLSKLDLTPEQQSAVEGLLTFFAGLSARSPTAKPRSPEIRQLLREFLGANADRHDILEYALTFIESKRQKVLRAYLLEGIDFETIHHEGESKLTRERNRQLFNDGLKLLEDMLRTMAMTSKERTAYKAAAKASRRLEFHFSKRALAILTSGRANTAGMYLTSIDQVALLRKSTVKIRQGIGGEIFDEIVRALSHNGLDFAEVTEVDLNFFVRVGEDRSFSHAANMVPRENRRIVEKLGDVLELRLLDHFHAWLQQPSWPKTYQPTEDDLRQIDQLRPWVEQLYAASLLPRGKTDQSSGVQRIREAA
jgi:hypothetical protein